MEILYYNNTDSSTIETHLNLDDNINIIVKKIACVIKKDPNSIYVWASVKVQKNITLFSTFIRNVFQGDNFISIDKFNTCIVNYFNINIHDKDHEYKYINKDIAFKILDKLPIKNIIIPVCHYYSNGPYIQYLPYNPIYKNNNIIQDANSLYLQDNSHLTLETVLNNDDFKLHVIDTSYKNENTNLYFPFKDNPKQDDVCKLVKYLNETESEFMKAVDVSKVSTTSFLSILYLRSKIESTPTKLNLALLFEKSTTSETMPFIKYKAQTNIYHKVNKKLLASNIDIHKWYQVTNLKLQSNTYILFKVKHSPRKYISIVLHDDGHIDIRFTFHVKDEAKLENIHKSFPAINNVIQLWQPILNTYFPLLPRKLIDITLDYDIVKFAIYNVAGLSFKTNLKNAEAFVKSKMFTYFDIIPDKENNTLRLLYKKVDHFTKNENIMMFISRHRDDEVDDIIKQLQQHFSLSKEDAINEYEKWEAHPEVTEGMKYDRFVDVKLRFNSPIDVKYVVNGLTSVGMTGRITNLVNHILVNSESKVKETKKDAEAKALFEKEQPVINIPLPEDNIDIDIDLEGLDEDWDDELGKLEEEFASNPIVVPEPKSVISDNKLLALDETGEDASKKLKGFVKRMLDSADRDLFTYKSETGKRKDYASLCGWVDRRQPVVITATEKKEIDEKYPGAYKGYVQTGSTTEHEKNYYYICPKIWCPKSRVAVRPGDECPGKNEDPIVFESKSYWGLGEKAMNRDHYPGFLDKHTREDGLCLPCCFKLQPKEGNRNKKRQDLCVPKSQQGKEDIEVIDKIVEDQTGERYIKSDTYFPLETSRYGLLPAELHTYLGKTLCGNRHNGTGSMTEKTDCYLRRGINHGNQSFIYCIISCLNNPKINTYVDFIESIKKNLDIYRFLLLENGKILELFVDRSKNIFGDDFEEFRTYFMKQDEYIAKFNLLKLRKELENNTSFSKDLNYYKDIIREFLIYFAYKNFINYIEDDTLEKDHRILLDMVNINDWLNINEYNFVVFDVDINTGKVYIDCSLNRDTKSFVNRKTPFVFMIKQGKFYEPMVYVKMSGDDAIINMTQFNIQDKTHPRIKDVITFYYQNCSSISNKAVNINIPLFLESKGFKTKYYVIDYNFRLCGLLLMNNLYIPFQYKKDAYALKGLRFVYINDIVLFKCLEDKPAIRKVYRLLAQEYGSYYNISTFVVTKTDKKTLNGFVIEDETFVPLNINSKSLVFKGYLDDLYIFTGEKDVDERLAFMNEITNYNDTLIKRINDLRTKISTDDKIEIAFLKDERNPLPVAYKKEKLMGILNKYIDVKSNKYPKLIPELTDIFYNKFFESRQGLVKKFTTKPNEVIFDYIDIQNGKIEELVEHVKNPYKLFHSKLEALFESYVFDEESGADLEGLFNAFINAETEYKELPVKYGQNQYRKMLKGYSVIEREDNVVFDLLLACTPLTIEKRLDIDTAKDVIKTNIIKDYRANDLELFYANPSYQYHIKKLRIKEPMLDDVLDIFMGIHYKPSFYELKILARVANINIIIIGRQTTKNPEGLFEVIYVNSPFYLFLVHSFDRTNSVDKYNIVIRGEKDIVLSKKDLPTEMIELINKHLKK